MDLAVARENDLLVMDLENDRRAITSSSHLEGMTERHGCDLDSMIEFEPDPQVDRTLEKFDGRGVVFMMDRGLPHKRILRPTGQLLKRGKSIYYFWPDERVIEVVDEIRLSSFRKHRAVAIVYNGLMHWRDLPIPKVQVSQRRPGLGYRILRAGGRYSRVPARWGYRALMSARRHHQMRALRRQLTEERMGLRRGAGSAQYRHPEFLDSKTLPSTENKIEGGGLYIRLDYWAKIMTGGSYGHTCFLAKALSRVTSQFECVMANRFDLLDDLDIRQRVVGGEYSTTCHGIIFNAPQFEAPLRTAFDEVKPAYVYERLVLGNRVAAQLCVERGVPYIIEYNGSELSMARSFGQPYEHEAVLEELESYAFEAATLINVISEPVAESLYARGCPKEKILVNPNAVDPDFYRPLGVAERAAVRHELGVAADDILIGFCGTFGGWHGVEVLAAGLPKICALSPRVKFLLIGDGNLKSLVKKTIADHGLECQVIDVGLVPQLKGARYLGAADILVATHAQNIDGKTFFGSPTKLFEYMAIGAGIVCSDLAQLGEVMRPALLPADFARGTPEVGRARGLLVSPGNTEEYVEAVARLVADADLRASLGRNARQAAIDHYTWDIHAENIWRHMAGLPLMGYFKDRLTLR